MELLLQGVFDEELRECADGGPGIRLVKRLHVFTVASRNWRGQRATSPCAPPIHRLLPFPTRHPHCTCESGVSGDFAPYRNQFSFATLWEEGGNKHQ